MLLLHIKDLNKSLQHQNTNVERLTFLKEQLTQKIQLLNLAKTTKKLKSLSLSFDKTQTSESFIEYVINISLSNTNINVCITDIKGKINSFLSSGSLGLNGKQKTKKPALLIKLLRLLVSKVNLKKSTRVALHLKNFTEFNVSLILKMLKKYLVIELVRVYNNTPHNGCRPKKLKRKKRRRVFFTR